LVILSLVWGSWSLTGQSGLAAEQAQEFLDRLRERGYYDVALEYLQGIAANPQCPAEFKTKLDYELGLTLIGASRTAGTLPKREECLDKARDSFQKFVKDHPKHALTGTAATQCANVLVERGRIKGETANQPSKSAAEKKALYEAARGLYLEAQKIFESAEKVWYEVAKKFEGQKLDPKKDAQAIEQRDEARRELVQARLFLAQVMYEVGKTYEPKSKEHQEWLGKSAKKYNELYTKYGQLIGGLYSHMWEGRIYKELGQYDKAVAALKELMVLPDEPDAFRNLKLQALAVLAETYFEGKKYVEGITEVEKWEKEARADDESSENGLKAHYYAGLSALQLVKSFPEGDAKAKPYRVAAKAHLERVARFEGEFKREALAKVAEMTGQTVGQGEPTNYAEAKERGDTAWTNMVLAMDNLAKAKTKDEQAKVQLQLDAAAAEGVKYYRMALGKKLADADMNEVNLIRFRMSYLYWTVKDLQRAALLGNFLAFRYPTHVGARKSAEIAVKAYRKMFTEALGHKEDTTYESEQMSHLALYIAKRWANEPEAEEAWSMLIDTAVDSRDVAKAMEYLEKIPADSPKRAQADLRTGEALWRAYAQAANLQGNDRPPQEQLDKMVKQAQEVLEQGIARMRKALESGGEVNYSLAYCVLSLANIYVGTGQSEKAVAFLDDPKIGPMTLIKAKSPMLEGRDLFVEAVFNAALQAYVGVQQLDKAEEVMSALEAAAAKTGAADAGTKLTQMYIRLGKQLEETLTRLRNEGKNAEAKKVASGFEVFLTKISQRKEGNTFGSLYWVAETFFSMGTAANLGGKGSSDEAKQYYARSAATYLGIVKRIKEDAKFAPPGSEPMIKVRLAICLREMGEFDKALKLLVGMLREKENRLDIQKEAAQTYMEWGAVKPSYYENAIKGGNPENGRYLVWGWGGIAKRVMGFLGTQKKYDDLFHEARYNLAQCRFKLALTQAGTVKDASLEKAQRDIELIYRMYPKMGGDEMYGKYDELLKTIQKMRRVSDTGLKGLEQAAPPAKTNSKTTSSASAASK
jgi:hypothetical protein